MSDKRAYLKGWQDKRPGWTCRVRWLEGYETVRLEFTDPTGKCSRVYNKVTEHGQASRDYEAFIAGDLTVEMILEERYDG